MSKRNKGRSGPLAADGPVDDLFEMDEKILGEINRADASMIVAQPISIHDMEPDPRQPRRAMPSAVRELKPPPGADLQHRMRYLLGFWGRLAFEEANGTDVLSNILENYRGCITGDIELPQASPREAPIQHGLFEVINLAAGIWQNGLINPITIAVHWEADSMPQPNVNWMIETGERRWLAHHLLVYYGYKDYDKIPAQIVDFDVWRQADENGRRDEMNAVARSRQFAILLMDLLRQDGARFDSLDSFQHEREYYAQVADSEKYRVPHGKLAKIADAMGLKSRQSVNNYRRLLSLPDNIWVIADDQRWSADDLLQIVQSLDISDDDEREPDTDPGQDEPVGESEAIPNIPSVDTPTLAPDEQSNVKIVSLDGVPESVSWWGAYKDLSRDLPEHLFFIRARNDFFVLREDAKALEQIVPSTMPGCHFTNTEFGMTFFCPQAVVDYVAESHLVAICDMRRKEAVNEFWHTHMVKNRQQKPTQVSAEAATPRQKWIPTVGEQVVVKHSGHLGKVTGLYLPKARVRTKFGERLYAIAELREATDADLERDTPPPGFESPGESGLPELPLNQMLDYIRQHSSYGRVPWSARRAGSGVFLDDGAGVNLGKLFWNSGFGEYLARTIAAVFTLILPSKASQAFIRLRSFEENGGNPSYLPGDAVQDARDLMEYLQGFIDRTEREMDWGPEGE